MKGNGRKEEMHGGVSSDCLGYLSEGGAFAFRLDGDRLGSPLQDLIDVFLAELGALVFFIH